jgi:hypothetical protein
VSEDTSPSNRRNEYTQFVTVILPQTATAQKGGNHFRCREQIAMATAPTNGSIGSRFSGDH